MAQADSHSKRYRGFVLTNEGLQKLNNCIQKLEAQTRMRYGANAIAKKVQLVESDGIHPITVRKILQCQTGVDYRSINHVFQALQLPLSEGDYAHADLCKANKSSKSKWTNIASSAYSNIPDIAHFYGRTQEIAQLESKIICDGAKVVALFGMLGVGKTATAIKLTHSIKDRFEFVIWKSLRQAPTLEEMLISVLRKLPTKAEDNNKLPTSLCSLIDLFLEKLEHHRCLFVLDGLETLTNNHGEETYSDFLQILLENKHQSAVVITSRSKPNNINIIDHEKCYSTQLNSLQLDDIKKIFNQRGIYNGSSEDWINLVNYYAGNPLALKMVANQILQYFEGNISVYLKELASSRFILTDFKRLLIEEFKNLSNLEQYLIKKLAGYSNEVSLLQLRQDLNQSKIEPYLLDILDYLKCRGLIEQNGTKFKLQPFLAQCVINMNSLDVNQADILQN